MSVQAEITPQPPAVGLSTVDIGLADAHGKPLAGAKLSVEADMSHPGMGPVLVEAKEVSGGHYRAQLEFTMAGDWVLLLHIGLPNGQQLERQVDVKGVRSK